MEKAVFVQHLDSNNIVVITDTNRRYYERQAKKDRRFILLDQYEKPINDVELSEGEAEIYVEEKLKDLQVKHDQLTERENALNERESQLTERENALNESKEKIKIDESIVDSSTKKAGRPAKIKENQNGKN